MLSKKNIQFIRSLAVKKYRQKYHKYFAEGEKICLEILHQIPSQVDHLYCEPDFAEAHSQLLQDKNIEFTLVTPKELGKISHLKTPNKAFCILHMFTEADDRNVDNYDKVLYLDDIRDPGNLGTILRTADWFGLDCVILSPACVDIYNPKVVQSSMGSLFRLTFRIDKLNDFLSKSATNYQIYFAEMNGANAFKTSFKTPLILVLGNESHGITLDLERTQINSVSIPRKGRQTESLNVAIAGSILISEICKS